MLYELKRSLMIRLILLAAVIISGCVIYFVENYRYQQKHMLLEKLSTSYVSLIEANISQALSATYPVAAMVRMQNGSTRGFRELAAEMLPFYSGASALELAPAGVIREVIPQAGNEAVIGYDLLRDQSKNKPAFLARATGQLTLEGPFELKQGGVGAIGRLPVFLTGQQGKNIFWGFSSVLIRFPEILDQASLYRLESGGFAYQLSRLDALSGKEELIAGSEAPLIANFESYDIRVPNGLWIFRVSPEKGYLDSFLLTLEIMIAVIFCGFITLISVLISRLKNNHAMLEVTVDERTRTLNDSLKRLNLAMGASHQAWFDIDVASGDVLVSDEYARMLGYDPQTFKLTVPVWEAALHPDDKARILAEFDRLMNHGEACETEFRIQTAAGGWMWQQGIGEAVEWTDGKPSRVIGINTDITRQKKIEALDMTRNRVLELLLEGTSLEVILEAIIETIEMQSPGSLGSVLLLDEKTNRLYTGAGPNLPAFYNEAIDGVEIGEMVGSCGRAAYTGERMIVSDIDNHPNWAPFLELTEKANLRACWSEPVLGANNRVLATFAIYHSRPHAPEDEDIKLIEFAAQLVAIAIERHKTDEKLQLSARIFNETHESIMVTDIKGAIVEVNGRFSELTGYSAAEVIGQNPGLLSSGRHPRSFYDDLWAHLRSDGHWQGEIWNRHKDGYIYAILMKISAMRNSRGEVINYVGLASDITQHKEQENKLRLMAHYDELTRLPNRTLFADRFRQAIAHSKRHSKQLAICFLDLDDFKPVNDQYGHEVGDQLIIEVAKRINTTLREEDTVSRQGGDEFAMLLGDIESLEHCEAILQRIIGLLSHPYMIDGHVISISASVGVTLYPDDNADLDTLMRHADQSMYQAKLAGRNRYHFFNTEKDQQLIQQNQLLDEIATSLDMRHFCLHYQPKVNMRTGKVFGVEALIRWQHPEKGLLSPFYFLPAVEGSELEIQIGDWVISEALQQLSDWTSMGLALEVSINISSNHLRSGRFLENFATQLARYANIDTGCLQLEVLESSALGDLDVISDIIRNCQNTLGVKIALDDFGTGYSSLAHLRSLSAGTIKIDQSFVRDMLVDPNDYAIIDGVLGLADSFNRDVIAEGVETTEHGLMLLSMGCNEAQGYGIARPMPASDIPGWLEEYSPNAQWRRFSQIIRSDEDNKIQLLRLTTKHWYQNFEAKILAPRMQDDPWAIMETDNCHFRAWITRARQEQVFDPVWLERLADAQTEFQALAAKLVTLHSRGDEEQARNELAHLNNVFNELAEVLARYKPYRVN
ncbi:bifunctional diguanylate cyclase/phosphodiesterase [Aliamphritea hakodatensis]|uniref:bifunctional diguanylate cyclase/phosphodiesterase n=1 Tax=Aliamphritea hakodatensis TaxID=2895352 RepID=UPI0022FDA11A|nr:EAL domain-containing protein [Aliamphritea hakodatensis]